MMDILPDLPAHNLKQLYKMKKEKIQQDDIYEFWQCFGRVSGQEDKKSLA